MKSVDPGILDQSVCFAFTPPDLVKKLFFYPTWCGHYFCTSNYFMKRNTYPNLLLVFIREGELHIEYDGKVFDAQNGDVVLLDCQKKHYYHARDGLEFIYLHFDGSNSHEICEYILHMYGPLIRNHNNELVGNCLYNMVQFYNQNGIETMFDSSMKIYKVLQLLSEKDSFYSREENKIDISIRYIQNNIGKQITLKELAEVAWLSPSYYSHYFKEKTGLSPIDFVINTRINRAKILLVRTSKTVEEISYEVGYSSSVSFINSFKKKIGESPTAWRKQQ